MKVLQVPFCFHPDPMGGTEVYVRALAHILQDQGTEVVIAASSYTARHYVHEGIQVRRCAVRQGRHDLRQLYGLGDELAANAFAQILDEEQPDIVHLHALTSGVSLRTVHEAKKRKIPVVFTYHTPTVTCQRGTMMRWGSEPCCGLMELRQCSQCALHGFGLNRAAAVAFGSMPPAIGERLGQFGLEGGVWTALRMSELVELRHVSVRTLFEEVDHIVAVCEWVRQVLLRNGVCGDKIMLCRQGYYGKPDGETRMVESDHRPPASELRIAFLGRLDQTKGLHILLQALRLIPEAPILLDIFGIPQGEAGACYVRDLKAASMGDGRIQFRAPVTASAVMATLQGYDLLAVPSQWLETGPLTVLEAFAAGVPVIGSRLGGIAELVEDGVNGILVEPASAKTWAAALRNIATNRDLLKMLKDNIRPPRSMNAVAGEMLALYNSKLSGSDGGCSIATQPKNVVV
jgi:glycosyltransferase involved in cell wall biosynthesis